MDNPILTVLSQLLLVLVVSGPSGAGDLEPDYGISATFSIVAVDPETGDCGAAVASKFPGVGRIVPYVRADVGAFCTQHWHHPPWGEKALDLLAEGHGPEEVLGVLLQDDVRRDKRQLAIIDMQGRAANRNPADADPAGIYWGAMSGRFFACQGNTLTGREVLVAMAKAYEETEGSLADRLMAAIVAGDRAGGDHRGRLAAGIRVARKGHEGHWFELYVDESDDAVNDLLVKYVEIEHEAKGRWAGRPINDPRPHDLATSPSDVPPRQALGEPGTAVLHCPPTHERMTPHRCQNSCRIGCPLRRRSSNR